MLGLLHTPSSPNGSSLKKKASNMSINGALQAGNASVNGSSHLTERSHHKGDSQSTITSPRLRTISPMLSMNDLAVRRVNRPLLTASASYSRYVNTYVKDQHTVIRQRCERELGNRVPKYAFDTSYEGLLDWIRTERLTRMPHKGGSWDRCLIVVQHFAEQVHEFTKSIGHFTDDCGMAANLMFGHCLLLLDLGHENASALEKAFNMFYQFGLELVPLLRCRETFSAVPSISENVGRVFADLLNIVTAVAISFHRMAHSCDSTTIDAYKMFASQITCYRQGISQSSYAIWEYAIGCDNGARLQHYQRLLCPQDSVLAFLAANRINITNNPEQFTCTWFQSHLTSFIKSDERVLMVEGKAGTGKTTLANWTVDRLQRPIARRSMTTITFFYNSNVPAQKTSLAMVRTLLQQLLIQRVGDVNLFHAINDAFAECASTVRLEEQEDIMWEALRHALCTIAEAEGDSLTIVIDGVDEIEGQKPAAQKACQRLYALTKASAVRLIMFSQHFESSPESFTRITLTSEYLYNDIATVARRSLMKHAQFEKLREPDQEKIVEQLAKAADVSLLWVYLACQYLLRCSSIEDSLKSILATCKNINEAVQKVLSVAPLDHDAKGLISYMAAAQRPLYAEEIKLLLQAQPDRCTMIDRNIDVQCIIESMRPFIVVREGLVAIRHNLIKQALIAPGCKIPLENRHQDFVLKLLIYAKTCLVGDHQPCIEPLDPIEVNKKVCAQRFLEYAVRYWAVHFKKSCFHKADGTLELPKDFSVIFPGSVMFTLLEEGCWASQLPSQEVVDLCILAFRIRKALYGEKQACVMQSAIIVARMYHTILCRTSDAIEWYVRAAKFCRTIVGFQADLTFSLCELVLHISESLCVTKRNTIMCWREEILLILVSSCTQRYGESSTECIEIMKKLVEFYVFICEEHKVIEWRKKIEICLHGGDDCGPSREVIVDVRRRCREEIDTYECFFFKDCEDECDVDFCFDDCDRFWGAITLCITNCQFEKAEELYIELWLRLTEHCSSHCDLDWHCKKIEIMLEYARFLQCHKRESEACTILMCIWSEYEHHELSSFERITIILKDVAICMKSMGMLTVCLAVFKKCHSWFKHAHKEETTICKEIETHLTTCSTEVVRSTTTTTTSEVIIRGVFESACSSSETITETTVELCQSLCSTYIKEEKYSEAITCIEMAVKKCWSSFFSSSEKSCVLESTCTSRTIELVMNLALCYSKQKRYEKVEEIYLRLYRCHRKKFSVEHESCIKYAECLLSFYKEHSYFNKAICFYQELLVEYRICYGYAAEITIRTLYCLGDLCRQHHLTHGYWIEYYLEIITNLNKGSLICHESALRALIIVAEHHYEACRYTEAYVYFKCIFDTFCKHGTSYKYFEHVEEVRTLIEHYFCSIEEAQIDIEIHIKIVEELRKCCLTVYKEHKEVCCDVSMCLATVCRRSEKHEFKAIELYEYISCHSTTRSKEVRSAHQYLCYKRITTTTTTCSKEFIETCTKMTFEKYCETRKSYSCTHEKTITELCQLVELWCKQGKKELIIKELRTIMLEIICIKSSKELIACGKSLAQMYISCGYQSECYELIRELRMQVIYKCYSKDCGFKVTIGRECLAFIASLEYYVRCNWSITIAMLMADLLAEYSYYYRFSCSLKIKASWEIILMHGARLLLIHKRRNLDFGFVENEAVNYFCQVESEVTKQCHRPAIRQLIRVLFEYCSTHRMSTPFTITVSRAAIAKIRELIKMKKECLELTKCTFYFLMAHEGLDDPTEITVGFQLCLLMSRGDAAMVSFSKVILGEIFNICQNFNIDLARIQLDELNELIEMIGQQKDYARLHWLLRTLWSSREGQTKWPREAVLKLGMRLVQAEFAAGHTSSAIRLCEDIVYNIRRVHGARHQSAVNMSELLASLYTSIGLKSNDKEARYYFKKAMSVQEDVLKALLGLEEEDDDELFSEYNGSVVDSQDAFGCQQDEVDAVVRHTRKLRLSMQRLGGWCKPSSEYERLTDKVWSTYGNQMKLKEDEVRAGKWKVDKISGDVTYDCFGVPPKWDVVHATTTAAAVAA